MYASSDSDSGYFLRRKRMEHGESVRVEASRREAKEFLENNWTEGIIQEGKARVFP